MICPVCVNKLLFFPCSHGFCQSNFIGPQLENQDSKRKKELFLPYTHILLLEKKIIPLSHPHQNSTHY